MLFALIMTFCIYFVYQRDYNKTIEVEPVVNYAEYVKGNFMCEPAVEVEIVYEKYGETGVYARWDFDW